MDFIKENSHSLIAIIMITLLALFFKADLKQVFICIILIVMSAMIRNYYLKSYLNRKCK